MRDSWKARRNRRWSASTLPTASAPNAPFGSGAADAAPRPASLSRTSVRDMAPRNWDSPDAVSQMRIDVWLLPKRASRPYAPARGRSRVGRRLFQTGDRDGWRHHRPQPSVSSTVATRMLTNSGRGFIARSPAARSSRSSSVAVLSPKSLCMRPRSLSIAASRSATRSGWFRFRIASLSVPAVSR